MRYKILIFLSAVMIGLIGTLVKLIGDAVPAMSLNFLRMFFATLFILLIVPLIDRKTFKVDFEDLKGFAITGGLIACTFSLYVVAMLKSPVSNVALITSLYIFFVAIFAYFFLKEKLTYKHAIYIPLALIGIYILNPFQPSYMSGSLIALLQSIFFASFIIYLRFEEKEHGVGSVFWFFLFATIFLSPFIFIYGVGDLMSVIHYIIILAVLSTAAAYILLAYALHRTKANTAAIITFITAPISSIIFANLIIDEAIPWNIVIAGALLLSAGIIALWKFDIKKHFVLH